MRSYEIRRRDGAPRGNPLITSVIRGVREGRHGIKLREKERLSSTTLAHERACVRAHKSGGAREKRREEERKRRHEKEEGVGALRRSFDKEARQSTRENAFCPPTLWIASLSLSLALLGQVNPSSLVAFISFSFTLSPGGGHGPRFAVGTTRATGHEPRATPAWPDTTSSTRRHATVTFSPSLLIPVLSLSVCSSLSRVLSLSLRSGVHTRRVRPSQE